MSGGEMYFWAMVSLVGLLIVAACVAAFLDSRRYSGRFHCEEEVRRIERQGR